MNGAHLTHFVEQVFCVGTFGYAVIAFRRHTIDNTHGDDLILEKGFLRVRQVMGEAASGNIVREQRIVLIGLIVH